MLQTSTATDLPETKRRLLEAAGEVFAEQGYKAATIRDICKRADANIAAVNYHFGDKENLYRETIRYAQICQGDTDFPLEVRPEGRQPKDVRLRGYIAAFLGRILDHGRPSWHTQLMAREMVDPTHVLDEIVRDKIRPHQALLLSIVRDYLGPDADPDLARHCGSSVLGQILFFHHARPVIQRLMPETFDPQRIDGLARHIFDFSHAALTRLAEDYRHGKKDS
jgi:TetR/AcrR family transcriptional regulator, regulator of cefoperazone and chloramphenicol sensitivity